MKVCLVLLLAVLAGCSSPPVAQPAASVKPVQDTAHGDVTFCAAAHDWLQDPALLKAQAAKQRGDHVAFEKAAVAWLAPTSEVLDTLPEDAPKKVRSSLTSIRGILTVTKRTNRAAARELVLAPKPDVRRVLTYIQSFCLGQ